MSDEILKLDEVEKIAEKFIQSHVDIDIDKQKIEFSHTELHFSDELGQYYLVEGKVKIRYESSLGFKGFNFGGFKAGITKECLFTLKISAKGGDVMGYNFKDIEPSQYVVSPSLSELRGSALDGLDSIDNSIRKEAETELLREIKEDIRDRRKRRKRII